MTVAEDFQGYVDNTKGLGQEAILGHVVLFKIGSDAFMPHADALRLATKYGLDKFLSTNPPTDGDRIRTAFNTGDHGTRSGEVDDGSGGFKPVRNKLRIVGVRNEASRIVRRVVLEQLDENDEKLWWGEAWEIMFNGTNLFTTQLRDDAPPAAGELVVRLSEKYRRTRGCISPAGFQDLVLGALMKAEAFNLSRAAYFVPQEHVDVLQALEDCVANIPEVRVNSFPLANNAKQQEFVATAAAESLQQEADTLMAEMAEYLKTGKVGLRRRNTFNVAYVELSEKIKHYVDILEDTSMLQKVQLKGLKSQLSAMDDELEKKND